MGGRRHVGGRGGQRRSYLRQHRSSLQKVEQFYISRYTNEEPEGVPTFTQEDQIRGLITNNYTPKTKHTRALTKKERYTLDMQVRKCKGRKALVYDEGYSKQQNSFEFKSYKK